MADPIHSAADIIRQSSALVITAGAGMGVDSGLPDFRSNEGFWKAYPPFRHLGLEFAQIANPRWFRNDPALAWGFYGHRLNLYRETQPHAGFGILLRWANRCRDGSFIFTSNVDGQFQQAGFPEDRIVEIHGSIHRMQALDESTGAVWYCDHVHVEVDEDSMRATGSLPCDPVTGGMARPNILMFGDGGWNSRVTEVQHECYAAWLDSLGDSPVAVVELGAGTAIPTVRAQGEWLASTRDARLIRINPREWEVPRGGVSIASGALDALRAIDAVLNGVA